MKHWADALLVSLYTACMCMGSSNLSYMYDSAARHIGGGNENAESSA